MDFHRYLFSIIGILVFVSCNQQRDIKHNSKKGCLINIEKSVLSAKKTLNFDKEINCFSWDSLMVVHLNESELRKYFDYKFKVVNEKVRKRISNKGKIEINQESWSYIFFYNKGTLLEDMLAIHDNELYLTTYNIRSKIGRKDAVFIIGFKDNSMSEMHFKDSLSYDKYKWTR